MIYGGIVQAQTVTGIITDAGTGDPLPGVNILVIGTSTGTATDINGHYSLQVESLQDTLRFSFIGYKTKKVPISGRATIDVTLKSTVIASGNQLVVVGYGSKKKKDITGAISEVNTKDIKTRTYKDVQQVLQGTTPGVIVQDEGGNPTSSPSIHIRGMGGINSEPPLYIVDGVVYDGGPINPNNIASISVLKDASAAIYGARASGGVILITTKRGKPGKVKLNVNAKVGFQRAAKLLQPLNAAEFAKVENLADDNAGVARKPAFNASIFPSGQVTRTNWMKDIFRTGKLQEYNIGVSGGSQKNTFYAAFDYRRNDGILLNTYALKDNFRINSNFQVNKNIELGEHLTLTYNDGQYGANTTSGYQGAIITAVFYPPNVTPYKPDGSFNGLPEKYAGNYGDVVNPVAELKRLDDHNPQTDIFLNPYLAINILKGLTFKSNLTITRNINTSKSFSPRVLETGKKFFNNTLTMENGTAEGILTENTLKYKHLFDNTHQLNILLGYTYQKNDIETFGVHAQDFAREAPQFRYFVNAQEIYPPTGGRTASALMSYYGRINYSYKDKYLLTGILRRDGSSKLLGSNKWGLFPSISAGWRISREGFLNGAHWLNNLKIRGSWGELGDLASLPSNAINIPFEKISNFAILGSKGTPHYGFAQNAISNPNLLWATSKQTDIGLDANFWNNRISLTLDYFNKLTERMIARVPVPPTAGVNNGPYINLPGKSRDRGWELSIGVQSAQRKNFNYDIKLNITNVKNKLLSLDKKAFPNGIGDYYEVRATLNPIRTAAGHPLYSYYVIPTAGTFKSEKEIDNYVNKNGKKIQPNAVPGDLKFIDTNHDGKIGPEDRVFEGSAFPTFNYGMNIGFSYKNIHLNLFFQGVSGNKLFNAMKYTGLNAGVQGYNMLKGILNAWSPKNRDSNIPRISATDPNNNFGRTSDFYLESGAYLRLKDFTVGYNLPSAVCESLHIDKLRLFITGENVFTITKYDGLDPEVGMDQYGVDLGRYPVSRSFMFGINLGL